MIVNSLGAFGALWTSQRKASVEQERESKEVKTLVELMLYEKVVLESNNQVWPVLTHWKSNPWGSSLTP